MEELDPRARPHIRRRIIAKVLMDHQTAGWSGDEKLPYICTCGTKYAMGRRGDGLALHQAENIQRRLDAQKESRS